MQNTQSEYRIIKGTAGDEELEKYMLCFLRDGADRNMANLKWLHHENLLHSNVIYYAMKGEEMAAIYTALPVIFRINQQLFPALQSIDTLTDIDHRGKGLFIKLANALYNDAAANQYKLVYGFPNPNSAPGFYKKLHWQSFGEAPFLFKPLNPFYFFKKIIKRKPHTDFSSSNYIFNAPQGKDVNKDIVIRQVNLFEEDYNEIWKLASKQIHICVDRSAAYLNWRYVDKPGEHYYRYGIYSNNKLSGIVVFSIKNKHGGLVAYVMELVFDPAKINLGKQLLKFANGLCKKNKVDVVLAWSIPGCFNYAAYKGSGYYNLPEKLRPQKLYLGARSFDESLAPMLSNIKNWYISYSDSDTA
ncbi:MAG: GNAT family N-acetyltransferase [Ferruginibacter sp.]